MSLTVDELRGIIKTVEMTARGGLNLSIETGFEDMFRLDDIKNFNPKSHWGWDFELPTSLEKLEDTIFKAKAAIIVFEFAKIVLADWKEVSDNHGTNVRTYRAEIGDETYRVSFTVDENGCYRKPFGMSRHHR